MLEELYTKIRYFLRDPDASIWSYDDLVTYFNQSQTELAQRIGCLRTISVLKYPPEYNFTFCFSWEEEHCFGDSMRTFIDSMARSETVCYEWEVYPELTMALSSGMRCSNPWETALYGTEPVLMKLPNGFFVSLFAAFDQEELESTNQRDLRKSDHVYTTRSGRTSNYYIVDEASQQFVLYPKPSTITWQDASFTSVLTDDGGVYTFREDKDTILPDDTGLISEPVTTAGSVFFWYKALPDDIDNFSDSQVVWPDWALKWVMYGTLERAYGADTDGFIPSLRDYWRKRKEIAIQVALKIMRMADSNVDYRMGRGLSWRRMARGGSLPSTYPRV